MKTLAAIRVKNGEIVQRAGRAADVSITPADSGFILHGALGPAPDTWVQSPDDALIGWSQEAEGIRIWTTHPEPTIRFVPDIAQEPDEEGNEPEPLPAPDWSRVLSVTEAQESTMEQQARDRATAIAQLAAVDNVLDTLPDEDVETLTYLYPRWDGNGVAYETDHKVRYQGVLYKVLQNHTSQPDWTPDTAVSLYVRFRNPAAGPQPWVQPVGGHDAYQIGDRVTHNEQTWTSDVADNVWTPGEYGWTAD